MPVTPSYPGVYIEEIPSGVRTISGVATSIAAFIGWAPRGAVDRAVRVLSWADYEREFGGLDARSLLGYAVYQFFTNGGQDAYIIRLVDTTGGTPAAAAAVTLQDSAPVDVLTLTAKNPGNWAEEYGVASQRRPAPDDDRFQLSVVFRPGTPEEATVEAFENLSMDETDRRFVETVINQRSSIINAALVGAPTEPPDDTAAPAPLVNGEDGAVLEPNTPAFVTALALATTTGGVNFLDRVDLFNLLCVPGETEVSVQGQLQSFCRARRAFFIADCAEDAQFGGGAGLQNGPDSTITGADSINSAFYFPWVIAPDPLQENRTRAFPPCGFVAGIYSKTDVNRGVFKAPAGTEASLTGVTGVTEPLTDRENGVLNIQAINCIRTFPVYGTVVWGARTLDGHNEKGSEWKYVPIRRLALFLEESLYRGTQWVVFEPNDEPLWSQIRLNVGAFMQNLFRQGAFQGTTPQQAYFVKCDSETTTQNDIDRGIVNIVVGFAPLKPAEFVIIQIQQIAGQIQT